MKLERGFLAVAHLEGVLGKAMPLGKGCLSNLQTKVDNLVTRVDLLQGQLDIVSRKLDEVHPEEGRNMYLDMHGRLQWWTHSLNKSHATVLNELIDKGSSLCDEARRQNRQTVELTARCKARVAAQCGVQQNWLRAIYNDVKAQAEVLQSHSNEILEKVTKCSDRAGRAVQQAEKTNEQLDRRLAEWKLAIDSRFGDLEDEVVRLEGGLRVIPAVRVHQASGTITTCEQALARGRSATPSGERVLQRSLSRDGRLALRIAAAQGTAVARRHSREGSSKKHHVGPYAENEDDRVGCALSPPHEEENPG